jgi:F-type H+-transporting ATPase subunit epsilon
MNADSKTFRCELIGPAGKLLDCRTTSVVFPAHDGHVGILCGHMPMLSELGMGVMRVAQPADENRETSVGQPERQFLVDGGFALVAENSIMVIAYEAMALPDLKAETIQSLLDRVNKNLAGSALSPTQRAHENERLRTLRQIAESIPS